MGAFVGVDPQLYRWWQGGDAFGMQDDEAREGRTVVIQRGIQNCRALAASYTDTAELELAGWDDLGFFTYAGDVFVDRWRAQIPIILR